jgi:hypothetical protein
LSNSGHASAVPPEKRDELAPHHHKEILAACSAHSICWDRKLASSPEVAQAEIIPSNHGPDVFNWHEAVDLKCPLFGR